MTIGIVPEGWWGPACRMAGVDFVGVPIAAGGARSIYSGDVQARIEAGAAVTAALAGKDVRFLLDTGAAGLTFVEGAAGITALALTHDHLGVPLISHMTDPLAAIAGGMGWSVLCQALVSGTWIKAVGDAGLAEDLRDFGIPSVMHLPPAAMEYAYATAPPDTQNAAADVSIIGDASAALFPEKATADIDNWPTEVRDAIGLGCKGVRFIDLYDHIESRDTGDADSPNEPLIRYFNARLRYAAALCRRFRDNAVGTLRETFGSRFRLVGRGWDDLGSGVVSPPPKSLPEYFNMFRTAAVNVCIWDGTSETTISSQHFEITAAGGFMMCYHHPAIGEYFKIGAECETFADMDELIHKTQYYVARPDKRTEIALAGQKRTLSDHLLRHRLRATISHVDAETQKPMAEQPLPSGGGAVATGRPSSGSSLAEAITTSVSVRAAIPVALPKTPGKVLIMLNPGKFTRYYLQDMASALESAGVGVVTCELGTLWQANSQGRHVDWNDCIDLVRREHIRAAISAGPNGIGDFPFRKKPSGELIAFLAEMNVPHIVWWTDHPQWNCEKVALRPDLQPILCSEHLHHFMKSTMAADEMRDLMGWPNCCGMPVAENPDRIKPARSVNPEFDVVTIVGSPPKPITAIDRFLEDDDPDVDAISQIVAAGVRTKLAKLWEDHAPPSVQANLARFGEAWVEARRAAPLIGAYRLFVRMEADHPEVSAFLRKHPTVYFAAIEHLWDLGNWQRTFVLMHLARRVRLGVFGADWSSVGLGGSAWIEHDEQSAVYARGRVAINISQAGEEEGLSHKPFQIAASGVAMAHVNRRGITDCFTPDEEVALFDTPGEACEVVRGLLADAERRASMADAARERLRRSHTWRQRLPEMLERIGVGFPGITPAFRTATPARREPVTAAAKGG